MQGKRKKNSKGGGFVKFFLGKLCAFPFLKTRQLFLNQMKPIVFGVELVLWKLVFFVLILLLSGCIQPKQPSAGNGAVDANSGSNQTIVSSQPSLMPDVSGCGSIQGSKERDECYNSFAVSGCGSIQDSKRAADCYDFFATNPSNLFDANIEYRIAACVRIGEQTSAEDMWQISRDGCYYSLSSSRIDGDYIVKDKSFCGNISTLGYKNVCYARITGDESFCEKAEPLVTPTGTFLLKDSCYSEMAELKKDVSLCEKVDDFKDSCYNSVASATGDFSICEKISSSSYLKDYCFSRIAVSKKDSLICANIQDVNARQDCEAETK
jgi:hypothetical protein